MSNNIATHVIFSNSSGAYGSFTEYDNEPYSLVQPIAEAVNEDGCVYAHYYEEYTGDYDTLKYRYISTTNARERTNDIVGNIDGTRP